MLAHDDINIKTLAFIIEANFPGRWRETEACLATMATLWIEDVCNPTVLNLVGAASSSKTTVLSFLKKTERIVYFTDSFSPKSFVSCYANTKAEKLPKIDLLPQIKHKVMVVPELAPIFRARIEDLTSNIAVLTRVFDGEGLWVNSGTTGGRGYRGDYMFCWLGATTPFEHTVWKVMGQLGSRMFFLAMKDEEKTADDLVGNNRNDPPYKMRRVECQQSVDIFLNKFFPQETLRTIKWDKSRDDGDASRAIAHLAIILAHLRCPLQIWTEGHGDEQNYVHRRPIKEQPDRANAVLYNFARGRALLFGRNFIMREDVPMVAEIAFSSMPDDRRRLFEALIKNDGIAGTSILSSAIGCSPKVIRGLMEQFIALNVADDATDEWSIIHEKAGSDEKAIKLKAEYKEWLCGPIFQKIFDLNKPPETDGVI